MSSRAPIRKTKAKRRNKHPIQEIVSVLPQLAISFAILYYASTLSDSTFSEHRGFVFYLGCISALTMCSVFLILQIKGVEYKNWQQNPTTRNYIQIASLSTVMAFIAFNVSLWPLYGLLTPFTIIAFFVFAVTVLIISTAFL
ncbi:hypothetical protein A0J61_11507 [Choanephora cucurbitarum]|uniref:Uncharacterized protein n=1 Tax=Choanephora cucurbitarum TaxID=101091 RepID=A0A1C7MZ72_9FUNG|nr:hypothetical protein A0J61_11507 [Choanephora cucurbitarum]